MKGYKGFEKGLICRGKKYAENTVFEEENAVICHSGMHFCDLPHAVFEYYAPGENHEFAEVESMDEPKTDDNRKYCCKKLKIGAKISVFDMVKISVSAFFAKFDFSGKIAEAKKADGAAAAGDMGAAAVGDWVLLLPELTDRHLAEQTEWLYPVEQKVGSKAGLAH